MRTSSLVLFALLIAFSACSQNGRVEKNAYGFMLNTLLQHSVKEVDVAAVNEFPNNVQFVDAREKEEFDVSHIDGAVWVGFDDFDPLRLEGISKTDTVIVYCSVGYRSEKVAEKLEAEGYQFVWNMYGGIFEWKNQDREVVDPQGEPTEKVHAFDKTWGRWLMEGEKVY